MTIILRHRNFLPASCRKASLFRAACREALGRKASQPGEMNVIFTTNRGIRRTNKRYLGHDWNTDVIAFPYTQHNVPEPCLHFGKRVGMRAASTTSRTHSIPPRKQWSRMEVPFGDIFVSVDQARIQARELGHSLLEELLILAIHGTLHLMGYDDHAAEDRRRMFARQGRILRDVLR